MIVPELTAANLLIFFVVAFALGAGWSLGGWLMGRPQAGLGEPIVSALVDDGSPYTATYPVRAIVPGESEIVPTPDELLLLKRLRQAAGQGRMVLVDPVKPRWWLVGSVEHGR